MQVKTASGKGWTGFTTWVQGGNKNEEEMEQEEDEEEEEEVEVDDLKSLLLLNQLSPVFLNQPEVAMELSEETQQLQRVNQSPLSSGTMRTGETGAGGIVMAAAATRKTRNKSNSVIYIVYINSHLISIIIYAHVYYL